MIDYTKDTKDFTREELLEVVRIFQRSNKKIKEKYEKTVKERDELIFKFVPKNEWEKFFKTEYEIEKEKEQLSFDKTFLTKERWEHDSTTPSNS